MKNALKNELVRHTNFSWEECRISGIVLVSFYPVTGQAENCVWTVSYKSFPAQNRLQSLNTSISELSDLGFPLLIGGLARFGACCLGLSPAANSIFSCRYRHPFRNAFTSAVSGPVVAVLYCVFTFPAMGTASPITVCFTEHRGMTEPAHFWR